MTKPILIFLERHWDPIPKKVLRNTLPELLENGYQTLCFENPVDDSEELIIAGVQSTISQIKSSLNQAYGLLSRRGRSHENLCDMEYSKLYQLLELYVSSKHYSELALHFKELPGHKAKLALLQQAKSMHFNMSGVDLTENELSPLRSEKAQYSLQYKTKIISNYPGTNS